MSRLDETLAFVISQEIHARYCQERDDVTKPLARVGASVRLVSRIQLALIEASAGSDAIAIRERLYGPQQGCDACLAIASR
jgi:hypothetical protein